jgi:cytoskeletal protein CcmA (bactofilin family)
MGKGSTFIKKLLGKKDFRQQSDIADFHTTIIRVDNNFISSSTIMLDEMLTGNIYSLLEVIIAGGAEISGNIVSKTATISGKVRGDVTSIEYAEIKSTAVIEGRIRARSISVEAGAMINGSIYIEEKIDDRDLIEKVKNRLPSTTTRPPSIEPPKITYMLFEENTSATETKESLAQPKKPTAATKEEKKDKSGDSGKGAAASSSNNWY